MFQKGDKNPRWNGGTSQYKNHNLLKKRRLIVLERDEYTCQRCWEPGEIAFHLDGDKNNNELRNLETRCRSCACKGKKKTSKMIRKYGMTYRSMALRLGCSVYKVKLLHDKGELKNKLKIAQGGV